MFCERHVQGAKEKALVRAPANYVNLCLCQTWRPAARLCSPPLSCLHARARRAHSTQALMAASSFWALSALGSILSEPSSWGTSPNSSSSWNKTPSASFALAISCLTSRVGRYPSAFDIFSSWPPIRRPVPQLVVSDGWLGEACASPERPASNACASCRSGSVLQCPWVSLVRCPTNSKTVHK